VNKDCVQYPQDLPLCIGQAHGVKTDWAWCRVNCRDKWGVNSHHTNNNKTFQK